MFRIISKWKLVVPIIISYILYINYICDTISLYIYLYTIEFLKCYIFYISYISYINSSYYNQTFSQLGINSTSSRNIF